MNVKKIPKSYMDNFCRKECQDGHMEYSCTHGLMSRLSSIGFFCNVETTTDSSFLPSF